MKTKIIILFSICLLCIGKANAQLVVSDPSNFAQGIINTTRNVIQTTKTAQNMIKNFQQTVKIYKQGKEYYDALKSVNDLIKGARKVKRTILLVGEISDVYVINFQRILHDKNFSLQEINAIAYGYTKIIEQSINILDDLKKVVNISTLSMTDKDRMDVVDNSYSKMKKQKAFIDYYTKKNIAISYLRAKKKQDMDRIISLYGTNEKYW